MSGQDTRLLLFGGKGGVGKTTCSAAVAVALAARGVRTLHLTSDAAPSLADIYRVEIGGTTTPILPALDAMEITQETVARVWKEKFGPDFLHILSHIMDVEGMLEEGRLDLLDYIGTAPALREETLLDMVREMAEGGRYQRIIWDTAPAGETLKLLGMPKLMRQHLRAGARVYEAVDRLAGMVSNRKTLATVMEEWVLRSEQLASFLVERTRFFIVANPEALVVHQAERMLLALREAGFEVGGLVVNRVAERDGSEVLAGMHARQEPYVRRLLELAGGMPVARVPLSGEELRGVAPLRELGAVLLEGLGLDAGLGLEGLGVEGLGVDAGPR